MAASPGGERWRTGKIPDLLPGRLTAGVAQRVERLAPALLIVGQFAVGIEPRQEFEPLLDHRLLALAVRELGELVEEIVGKLGAESVPQNGEDEIGFCRFRDLLLEGGTRLVKFALPRIASSPAMPESSPFRRSTTRSTRMRAKCVSPGDETKMRTDLI
jgi:hypothetical protein